MFVKQESLKCMWMLLIKKGTGLNFLLFGINWTCIYKAQFGETNPANLFSYNKIEH